MKIGVATFVLTLITSSALAQERGYVQGIGGATFMARTAGVFGGEAGFHVSRDFVVFGQVGRMINVLPQDIQADIDRAGALLEEVTQRDWRFEAAVRATYAGGGVRYFLPLRLRARPYATGGIGMARYAGSLRERELGDVLDQAVALGIVESHDVKGTEIAYEVGGGVVLPRGRLQIDAGYRLMNVRGVNISRIIAGAGVRF
jgi:opacity protein-like surface antigen